MNFMVAGAARERAPEAQQQLSDTYDPSAQVQTGPGEPSWAWSNCEVSWKGPVDSGQKIAVILLPPLANRLLNIFRVIAVFGLLFGLCIYNKERPILRTAAIRLRRTPFTTIILLAMISMLTFSSAAKAADFPSDTLLRQLEQRLTKQPECQTSCVTMVKGTLMIDKYQMRIELTYDALEHVSVPLPGNRKGWLPDRVIIDGRQTNALRYEDNDVLLTVLKPGRHTVQLLGPVNGASVQLPFPFEAHNLTVSADGWRCTGLEKGRITGGALQFDKTETTSSAAFSGQSLLSDPIKPFVEVQRNLLLANEWSVTTEVRRIAPAEGAITLEVPLIPGESVLTPDIVTKSGTAKVVMNASQDRVQWQSTLRMADTITLHAAEQLQYSEIWSISAWSKWHLEFRGPAPIKQEAFSGPVVPIWKVKPRETLSVIASKPKPLSGAVRTIERVGLSYRPGSHSSENSLSLSVRASSGDTAALQLPGSSELRSVSIDGKVQIISNDKGRLTLLLHPGMQEIKVDWKDKRGVGLVCSTPELLLPSRAANIDLELHLPNDRWAFFVGGPIIGPAMLIWGILILLLLIAVSLERFNVTPLKAWQWFLLFVGISTVNNIGGIFVVLWFILLHYREQIRRPLAAGQFNSLQILTILLTIVAATTLVATISIGLLSTPTMQMAGNGSSTFELFWYQDHCSGRLPQGWIISFPLWVYRIAMLAWSLWLAFSLPKWTVWGWRIFIADGFWKGKANVQ
jgi:hypothetical protein